METVCNTTDSGLGMSYFAGHHVEVRERAYTIMEGGAGTINPQFLRDVQLPFVQPDIGELANRTQSAFYVGVRDTLDRDAALEGDETTDWKTIFKHDVKDLDQADLRRELARI